MASMSSLLPSQLDAVEWIEDDSSDDLFNGLTATVPDTPPQASPYFTQATQIVNRTTLQPTLRQKSSPVVEVPASSPFRDRPAPPKKSPVHGKIASLMAPAGTTFRPPPQARPSFTFAPEKDIIAVSDDDSSDDGRPMRGDIRPSTFARRQLAEAPLLAKARLEEEGHLSERQPFATSKAAQSSIHARAAARLQQLTEKLCKSSAGRYSQAHCRAALLKSGLDIERARQNLRQGSDRSATPQQQSDQTLLPFRQAEQSSGSSTPHSTASGSSIPQKRPSESISSLHPIASGGNGLQSPLPKRPAPRRLVQGRRPRASSEAPSSSIPQIVPSPMASHTVIVSDDEDDPLLISEDELAQEPLPPATRSRLLTILNDASSKELIAIATTTDQIAQLIIQKRPYKAVEDVHRVSLPRQGRSKARSSRVEVGAEVVRAIEAFLNALDGIDRIVAICERNATSIRRSLSSWELDCRGKPTGANRSRSQSPSTASQPDPKGPMPFPQEPRAMRGHCSMKSYQLFGLNWMRLLYRMKFGGILADDMGLGKTCQVISLIASLVEDYNGGNRPWPNLIIVPPSTLANWAAEFERFAPDVNVTLYSGTQSERDSIAFDIISNPQDHHAVITSYSQLGRREDIQWMRDIQPNVAVFDEGHKLKNPMSKLYRDLLRIDAHWRLLLTGTPVQNNLMEMVALLNFVHPNLFSAHVDDLQDLFKQKVSLKDVSNGALLYSERVAKARVILEPFILQRRKEQVLGDLPAKISRVLHCELGQAQAALYQEYEAGFKKGPEMKSRRKDTRSNDQNNVWLQLRKSAIHPQLFRRAFTDQTIKKMAEILMANVPQDELRQTDISKLEEELQACSDFQLHLWCRDYSCIRRFDLPDRSWLESAKVEALLGLIRHFKSNGDRVLVFTRYAQVVEILAECFVSEGISYLDLQGNTEVNERQGLINEFNEDKSITAFILTTAAGGQGINLTAANKVVIFDQSDNPMDDIQAENRAHRLGQEREVEVIRLLSKNTVEELVYAACQKKIELANRVTGWTDEGNRGSGDDDGDLEMTSAQIEAKVRTMLQAGERLSPPSSD